MSFRDVRDLTEQLKILGFTEPLPLALLSTNYGSLEAFKIYSSILQWLVARLEPGSGALMSKHLATEKDRVAFIRTVAEFLVVKAGIKVNPKKLYAGSSATAQEILKITAILVNTPAESGSKDEEEIRSLQEIDLSDKIDDLRRARELSSELTKRGATLYDLLAKEQINKDVRTTQASRPLDMDSVERSLQSAISGMEQKLKTDKVYLDNCKTEQNNLNVKLQRKQAELERSKQRLQALQKVRPAYLEEFERLEQDLKGLFEQYFVRVRCVDALKAQLAARDVSFETNKDSPIPKVTDGSMTILPEGLIDSDDEGDDEEANDVQDLKEYGEEAVQNVPQKAASREELLNRARSSTRLRARTGVAVRGADSRVIGNMTGPTNEEINNLDSSLGSDETESELDLNGDGLGHFGANLHSDLEDEEDGSSMGANKMTRDTNFNNNRNVKQAEMSDEDF